MSDVVGYTVIFSNLIMALQAGLPLLDFTSIRGRTREEYFQAVRIGMRKDYNPMKKIFFSVVSKTLKSSQ